MKSFRQKTEAKRKRIEEAKIQAQEQARLLKEEQEWKRFEKEQAEITRRELEEHNRYLAEENAKIYESEQQRKYEEQERLLKLTAEKSLKLAQEKENTLKEKSFRQDQKVTLKEILSGEYDAREELKKQQAAELAEEVHYIESIKEQDRLDAIEEQERLQLEEMERIEAEQLLESEKLDRWSKEEQEDLQEAKRIQEEVESFEREQLEQRLEKTAEKRKQEQIDWEAYAERQQILAEQNKEQRIQVNNVLNEVQQILDSERKDIQQQRLSSIHDYVFRLQPEQNDPWVNRPQPKSVLTWEEWKSVSDNSLLFEQDGRRARLLFEQDNARAQRYYETLQNWPETRLLYQGTKGIDKPLTAAQQLKSNFDAIDAQKMLHIDASDTSRIMTFTTKSLELDHSRLYAHWGTKVTGGSTSNSASRSDIAPNGAILSAPNSASAIDGDHSSAWRISHNSASYDLMTDFANVNAGGMVEITYQFETPQVLKKIELYALTRSSMPTSWDLQVVSDAFKTTGDPTNSAGTFRRVVFNHQTYSTGSDLNLQNNDVWYVGESVRSGSYHGIDSNGSASLDPYRINCLANTSSVSAVRFMIGHFATGSHIDINQIKFYVQDGEERPVQDGEPIYRWKNSEDAINPNITFEPVNSNDRHRHTPMGYGPNWYSGSSYYRTGYLGYSRDRGTGQVVELGGKWQGVPHVEFHRNKFIALTSKDQLHDASSFTHFIVTHGTKDFNYNSYIYSDRGATAERYQVYDQQFNGGHYIQLMDTHTSDGKLIFDIRGAALYASAFTGSGYAYPYPSTGSNVTLNRRLSWKSLEGDELIHGRRGTDNYVEQITFRDPMQRMPRITCVRLDSDGVTAHTASFWLSGGPEFRNDEKDSVTADWRMTGSAAMPTIGALWANHLHPDNTNEAAIDVGLGTGTIGSYSYSGNMMEQLMYNKALSVEEINTVLVYLSDKWKIPVDTAYEISGSVDGVVQSNPGYMTSDVSNNKYTENQDSAAEKSSSLQFERPKTLINTFTAS